MPDAAAVWVVDDDVDDQYLLEVAFKHIDPPIHIKQLYDGEELLPSLEQTTSLPRLILLDLNMVRQHGFETLQAISSGCSSIAIQEQTEFCSLIRLDSYN